MDQVCYHCTYLLNPIPHHITEPRYGNIIQAGPIKVTSKIRVGRGNILSCLYEGVNLTLADMVQLTQRGKQRTGWGGPPETLRDSERHLAA